MTIRLSENLITFAEAADCLPRRRRGRKTAISTFYRWSKGLNGIRLETIQCGGTKCTTLAAIERFFQRLAVKKRNDTTDSTQGKNDGTRGNTVEKELDNEGI